MLVVVVWVREVSSLAEGMGVDSVRQGCKLRGTRLSYCLGWALRLG